MVLNKKQITFCIPSKSNLRYLKTCIPSIRENSYRNDHEIIVFVDSDEDGSVKWLEQVKDEYNLKYFVNPNLGEHATEKALKGLFSKVAEEELLIRNDVSKRSTDLLKKVFKEQDSN